MKILNFKTASAEEKYAAVRIDRRTAWGNPFIIGRDGDRATVIAKYRVWLWAEIQAGRVKIADLAALAGRNLICHCAPLPCHGDVLAAAAQWAVQTEAKWKTNRMAAQNAKIKAQAA